MKVKQNSNEIRPNCHLHVRIPSESLSKPCTSFPIRAHSDEAPDVICIIDKVQLSKSKKFGHRSPLSSIKL